MNTQPYRFSASPDDPYVPFKRRAKRKLEDNNNFTAPEHAKASRHMERAYPVSHDGRKMVELGRELILDGRPTIMKPERRPIFLGLDQSET